MCLQTVSRHFTAAHTKAVFLRALPGLVASATYNFQPYFYRLLFSANSGVLLNSVYPPFDMYIKTCGLGGVLSEICGRPVG
jgi:hypothetical protein